MEKCSTGITDEDENLFQAQGNGDKPAALSKKQKAEALSKRLQVRCYPKGNIETLENDVGMQAYLDAQKVLENANKWTGEDDQKTVMGNVSVPEASRCLSASFPFLMLVIDCRFA